MKLFELMDVIHPHQDVRIYQGETFKFFGEVKEIPEELEHKEIECVFGGVLNTININVEE